MLQDPATNLMDKHKMVKGFSRSAAGQSTPLPNELRTINALEVISTNNLLYLIAHRYLGNH
jgi:hypothetical protein